MIRVTFVMEQHIGHRTFYEVDGETGFHVPPDDSDAVAQALERLLDDPGLRREMGQAARLVALLQEAAG